MSLIELQRQFFASVAEPDQGASVAWPDALALGLAVYRNAYRARLVDCLRSSFERTWGWIGDDSFDAAACHHLILHPPRSWTLDDAGRGFSDTLAALFPDDPEVEELAWLEWAMQQVFTSADVDVLDRGEFTILSTSFDDGDWANLRIDFVPGVVTRTIRTNCAGILEAIRDESEIPEDILLDEGATIIVWRQGLRSRFRLVDPHEAEAIAKVRGGATFGDLCALMTHLLGEERGIEAAGTMLGRWISLSMIAA